MRNGDDVRLRSLVIDADLVREGTVEVFTPDGSGVWDGPTVGAKRLSGVVADDRNWVPPAQSGQPEFHVLRLAEDARES